MKNNTKSQFPDIGRKYNAGITTRIMELHREGYGLDFFMHDGGLLVCIQDSRIFEINFANVRLIDLCFNQNSRGYTYIHAIETYCGVKGVILTDKIICNS